MQYVQNPLCHGARRVLQICRFDSDWLFRRAIWCARVDNAGDYCGACAITLDFGCDESRNTQFFCKGKSTVAAQQTRHIGFVHNVKRFDPHQKTRDITTNSRRNVFRSRIADQTEWENGDCQDSGRRRRWIAVSPEQVWDDDDCRRCCNHRSHGQSCEPFRRVTSLLRRSFMQTPRCESVDACDELTRRCEALVTILCEQLEHRI